MIHPLLSVGEVVLYSTVHSFSDPLASPNRFRVLSKYKWKEPLCLLRLVARLFMHMLKRTGDNFNVFIEQVTQFTSMPEAAGRSKMYQHSSALHSEEVSH